MKNFSNPSLDIEFIHRFGSFRPVFYWSICSSVQWDMPNIGYIMFIVKKTRGLTYREAN